ncbi:TMEM165/GDT1 family protein [Calothrix rhizosoleniae]|uniref:TMEM165/GDT1 family protein n=1 Tax=Calothrix rhizosoleniae TaxID=888997 RepID=UPI003898F9BD
MTKLLPVKIDSAPEDITASPHTPNQEIPDNNDSNHTATVIETTDPVKNSVSKQKTTVVFGTTFVTIFLAEIGDKTQLSTLLMSAESHEPWMVFIGSAVALVTTSLLGVLVGSWMASKLSPKTIEIAAGMMLLLISFMLIGDVFLS